jgi:hypothetical protein
MRNMAMVRVAGGSPAMRRHDGDPRRDGPRLGTHVFDTIGPGPARARRAVRPRYRPAPAWLSFTGALCSLAMVLRVYLAAIVKRMLAAATGTRWLRALRTGGLPPGAGRVRKAGGASHFRTGPAFDTRHYRAQAPIDGESSVLNAGPLGPCLRRGDRTRRASADHARSTHLQQDHTQPAGHGGCRAPPRT